MKPKLIVAILLLALLGQSPVHAQQKPPEKKIWGPVICGTIGLIVVGITIYHIWKWCKMIPQTPPPDNPPEPGNTNAPPRSNFSMGQLPQSNYIETIPGDAIGCWNVAGYTNQHGYDILMGTTLESSCDLTNWVPRFHFLGWTTSMPEDNAIVISVFDANWTRLMTRMGSFTNETLFSNLPLPLDQRQFYRLRKPDRFQP